MVCCNVSWLLFLNSELKVSFLLLPRCLFPSLSYFWFLNGYFAQRDSTAIELLLPWQRKRTATSATFSTILSVFHVTGPTFLSTLTYTRPGPISSKQATRNGIATTSSAGRCRKVIFTLQRLRGRRLFRDSQTVRYGEQANCSEVCISMKNFANTVCSWTSF